MLRTINSIDNNYCRYFFYVNTYVIYAMQIIKLIIEKLRQIQRNKCATDGDGIAPLDSN